MSNSTQPARGMRDFLPADVRKRNYVISIIKEVYEKYGFEPLETPSVENLETLMGKYGEEGNQLIFKILKRGEKLDVSKGEKGLSDLALRYDLTVPLARVVANYKNELPKFFKRYQIQPVWRADRPARGRFREFYQCDVDAIGSKSMIVEAELISAVCEILQKLGFEDFTIRINHREVLTGILDSAGVPTHKHTDALIALDKIDKIGREGVSKELKVRGISDEAEVKLLTFFEFFIKEKSSNTFDEKQKLKLVNFQKKINEQLKNYALISSYKETSEIDKDKLKSITQWQNQVETEDIQLMYDLMEKVIEQYGIEIIEEFISEIDTENIKDADDLLSKIKKFDLNTRLITEIVKFTYPNNSTLAGTFDLRQILSYLEGFSTQSKVKIDPTLARGLSYYTGAIFEINVPDLAGSLGGGGRYDGLIGMFGKEQIPACGFSLGLERILVVMEERGMFQKLVEEGKLKDDSADVMIACFDENLVGESLKLATELREKDLRVLVYPEASQKGKPMKYAEQIKVPFVCLLKETELADGKITLKNMQSGEQETLMREEVARKIK